MKNSTGFRCIHCNNLFRVTLDESNINFRSQTIASFPSNNNQRSSLSSSQINPSIPSDSSLVSSSVISPKEANQPFTSSSIINSNPSDIPKSQFQNPQAKEEEFNTCLTCYEKLTKENERELLEYKTKLNSLLEISKELTDKVNSKEFIESSKYNLDAITSVTTNIDQQIQATIQQEKDQQAQFWQLMNEYKNIKEKETSLWKELNNLEKDITSTNKESAYLMKEIESLQFERARLNNINIFNTLFRISIEENIPTIGGCRMIFAAPKLPNDEVNCGWGYILFLTQLLAMKLEYSFKDFKLKPYGNYSEIQSLVNMKSVSFEYNGLESMEYVNQAMIMYLGALKELTDDLIEGKRMVLRKGIDFIFTIKGSSINNASIILTPTDSYDNWRTCLKYILLILKKLTVVALEKESNSLKGIIDMSKKLKIPNQ